MGWGTHALRNSQVIDINGQLEEELPTPTVPGCIDFPDCLVAISSIRQLPNYKLKSVFRISTPTRGGFVGHLEGFQKPISKGPLTCI